MRLLFADEHVPIAIVDELIQRGASVLTLKELDLENEGIADDRVLEIAARYSSTVITFNRKDFIKLHRREIPHGGIILCKYNMPLDMLIDKIMDLLAAENDFSNRLFRMIQD